MMTLVELEQMQEVAAENFKKECLLHHENTNTRFDEDKFKGLLKEIDSDGYLNSCLVIAYSPHEIGLEPLLAEIETINMSYHHALRKKMDELDRTYAPYSEILFEGFLTIWLAGKKMLEGDQRGFDEIVRESMPKRYTISDSKSTRYLEKFITHPIYHTSVFRTVKYVTKDGEKWVYENHYFGVDTKRDEFFYENTMHQLARRHFTEERDILPDKSQAEYLWHFHSDLLDPSISWNELDAKCPRVRGVPLPFGPKFINLINQEIEKYCKEFGVKRESKKLESFESSPSHYPTKYWILMKSPDEAENIVSFHFLGAVSKLDKVDAVEAIPRYLEISLKRAVVKWIGREKEKAKTREERIGKEPSMVSIDAPIEDDKGDEKGSLVDIISGALLPTFELPDIDELFPDEIRNYIAKNLTKKSNEIAAKFGLSSGRIRQIKAEVEAVLEEYFEKTAYLGVYIPGPVDELVQIARLRYRKPYKEPYPDPKGAVPEEEKRLSKLAAKYPNYIKR